MVAHYLDESVGHGIDRYSFRLASGLRSRGVGLETVSAPAVLLGPLKSFFDFFVYLPILSLRPFRKCDLFHFTAPQAGFAIPLIRLLFRKKVVSTIYDLNPILNREKGKLVYHTVGRSLSCAIRNSDMLLVISSQTRKDVLQHFNVDPGKIRITLLAADGKFMKMPRAANDAFTIGYIGGFAGNKNVQFLLRAYAIFEKSCKAPCRLVLYGKGAQYGQCMELARTLGIRSAEFRGFADEAELVSIYNSFDVFVFPSTAEGFGLPIIEAQMCRVPVIVKAGAHVPEEVTRFCLKAEDEKALAALMEKVRAEGFAYTEEHEAYLARFTWDDCITRTLEAYDEALAGSQAVK
jgi:glycosyltransferase involved in cell wall biosynthesis